MRIPQSFFYKALKPGRYVGADLNKQVPVDPGGRRVVWFYPGRYEDAANDADYRRGFFALRRIPGIHTMRAVDFARDAWSVLDQRGLPAFTLDGHEAVAGADLVVFWLPQVFAAANIPSILSRLQLDRTRTKVGSVVNGCWAPQFLQGHIDWICAAPHGWLPEIIRPLLTDCTPASAGPYAESLADWDSITKWTSETMSLLSTGQPDTEQWLPIVETGCPYGDVDLLHVNGGGQLAVRPVSGCVSDALGTLRSTGVEGLRFVDSGIDTATLTPAVLMELTRLHPMAHLQVDLPAVHFEEFEQHWRAYKPHLIKPVLRLLIRPGDDPQDAIAAGRDALNDSWHGLTLVPAFDSFAEFSELVPVIETVTQAWSKAATGFEDRRPMRVQYRPASLELWADPPSNPSEDDLRRLLYECRHLAESLGNSVSMGQAKIEDVIARNWLAAASADLWDRLASLDLSERSDESDSPFDWLGWIRNRAGLDGPPTMPFARGEFPRGRSTANRVAPTQDTPSLASVPVAAESNMYGRRKRKAPISRRLQSPARNRLRICWGKTAKWRFFSHLDMVRVVERSIRVAGLPVSYSEGFHPRMKLSFGPPLSFGLISKAELFDAVLDRNVEDGDVEALRSAFPNGVYLIHGEGLPSHVPSLTETINEAEYSALVPLDAETAQSLIEVFFQQPSIQFTRPDRPDRKPFDPRVSLRSAEMEVVPDGVRWTIRLAIGAQGQIRPTEWAKLIFGFSDDQIGELLIERTALRVRQNDTVRSAFDLINV